MIKGSRIMEAVLDQLKDGNARSVDALATELDTTKIDVRSQLEFLERMGVIKKIYFDENCGCGGNCKPDNGFQTVGELWEVV